jgi:hypothetical protein
MDGPRNVRNRSLLGWRGPTGRSVADAGSTAIEEYKTLREEILLRIRLQGQLVNLNFIGIAGVATVAGSLGNWTFFLVVPILSGVLGLGWLDHLRMIAMLGEFIRRELWPHMSPSKSASQVPTWDESFSRANTLLAKQITGSVPPIVAFMVPPYIAIAIAYRAAVAQGLVALLYVDGGLCIVISLLALWVSFAVVLPAFTSNQSI